MFLSCSWLFFHQNIYLFGIRCFDKYTFFFRLALDGKKVIGWDDEWGVEWSTNTLKYGGATAYQRLNRRNTKSPQKTVLLMHDIAFRNPEASEELKTFVRLAKESGYIFSTIDKYETDAL